MFYFTYKGVRAILSAFFRIVNKVKKSENFHPSLKYRMELDPGLKGEIKKKLKSGTVGSV